MWGPLFIAVRGPFTIAAPPVAGHRLQAHRLSSCGSRAQLLHGMWDLPRPGLEPVSPALAGRFSTTAPPGKPERIFIALYPVLHMNVYLTWILDSHPQYPVCTIVITYEITVILCSPTTLAQSLGVHSLLPELSSLVSLISVSFPSNPSSTQASD